MFNSNGVSLADIAAVTGNNRNNDGMWGDGGSYGFWTDYSCLENGNWEISYGTTADMEFCPCCGSFGDHYDYDKEEYSCGDFETVTTDELLEKVNSFEEREGEYIEFK